MMTTSLVLTFPPLPENAPGCGWGQAGGGELHSRIPDRYHDDDHDDDDGQDDDDNSKSIFMYCVFHHISGQFQGKFCVGKFEQKLGIQSDPPCWNKISTFAKKNIEFFGKFREGDKKKARFRNLWLQRGPDHPTPPPFVVPWESEILGQYFMLWWMP